MMFSVVIPLYNKEQTIERAIRSVLNQTVRDFEIVVVNDGSTDGSPRVVRTMPDRRIRMVHQENQGVSAARNRGIAEARSELVAFLDADDEWRPRFLETVTRLVRDFPEAAVFATAYLFCGEGRCTWAPRFKGIPGGRWEGILTDYFAVAARSDPPVWSSAVAIRKGAIAHVGGFPVGVTSGEDLLTWAKLAVHYKIAFSKVPLSLFHLGSTGPAASLRRLPEMDDPVGRGLRELRNSVPRCHKSPFRRYIALWDKMRASVLLRAGRRSAALRHALRAAVLDPLNWRNYALSLFALCPSRSSKWLFGFALTVRRRREMVGDPRVTDTQIQRFYDRQYVGDAYAAALEADQHPYFPIVKGFIEDYQLTYERCLEIGCGRGVFQDLVTDYTGCDISPKVSCFLHKPFVQADAASLPFDDDAFDAVWSVTVLEHVPQPELALREICRVVKPGGVVLLAPAWHTRPWFAEGYPVRSFRELTWKGRLVKFSIPIRDFCICRYTKTILRRGIRLLQYLCMPRTTRLRYVSLRPNYERYWMSDSDACNSLDPSDFILWFLSRGHQYLPHRSKLSQLFVRDLGLVFRINKGLPHPDMPEVVDG
jgi:glycosyltransferase involved in cell wall biosynthesis/SAM-dependent methyltransferase